MSEGKTFSGLIGPSFLVLAFFCLILVLSRSSVRFNGIIRNFLLFVVACVEFCASALRGGHSHLRNGRRVVTPCEYFCTGQDDLSSSSALTDTRPHPGDYSCYRAACRRRGQRPAFVETMCSDLGALAHFCTLYSMAGIAFCGFVGVLITRQPFFLNGLKDEQHCKDSAFGAMGMFVFTFLISLLVLCQDSIRKRRANTGTRNPYGRGGHAYSQVPPLEGLQDYRVNVELPPSRSASSHDSDNSTEGVFT